MSFYQSQQRCLLQLSSGNHVTFHISCNQLAISAWAGTWAGLTILKTGWTRRRPSSGSTPWPPRKGSMSSSPCRRSNPKNRPKIPTKVDPKCQVLSVQLHLQVQQSQQIQICTGWRFSKVCPSSASASWTTSSWSLPVNPSKPFSARLWSSVPWRQQPLATLFLMSSELGKVFEPVHCCKVTLLNFK